MVDTQLGLVITLIGTRTLSAVKSFAFKAVLTFGILGIASFGPCDAFAAHNNDVAQSQFQESVSSDANGSAATPEQARANLADVISVYWSFTGTLNGEAVSDYIVYREYKTISYVNGYTQKAPTCIDVWSGSRYFPELDAIAWGTFEVWRCNYEIY